ncbi:unnamed protein product [Ceratitis capitata]|uniref:Odorant receptor n=1 Tax=Ceratitis capitata TaxID=7213 RepID=A0A811UN12_CERCA|nr:unnamed protein product [Ceratitis capitata]
MVMEKPTESNTLVKHAYQNLPLYSANVKLLIKWGYIGTPSRSQRFLLGLLPVLTLIGQVINIFKSPDADMGETGMNLFLLAIMTNSILKHFTITRKDEYFQRFLQSMQQWCNAMESYEDQHIPGLILDITRRSQKLSRITFYGSVVGTVCGVAYPFTFEHRKFIFDVQYPLFDIKRTPFYEINFLLQAFVLVPSFLCVYMTFTNLLFTFLMFGEVTLLDLRLKLQNISKDDQSKMLKDFKDCIAYHNQIIDFRDDLENLVSMALFFEVALFGLMFCMLLFFISLVHDYQLIFTAVTFIAVTLYMIAISFYFASKFTSESLEIANAAYDTPWYDGNLEMRKCVLTMIARSQRPLLVCIINTWE